MKRILWRWEVVLALLLLAEILIFGLINPRFLRVSSLLFGTSDFVQIGMVALPLTLVIIAGGIDVSLPRPLASAPLPSALRCTSARPCRWPSRLRWAPAPGQGCSTR